MIANFMSRAHGEYLPERSEETIFSQSKPEATRASEYFETAYRDVRKMMEPMQFCVLFSSSTIYEH